ncbi:MAG: hypothetical protein M1837_000423 [Sclerophora amabilis]|nr:MAG: hypothetical protein M1837_000423 [Sclerophora amabilis]
MASSSHRRNASVRATMRDDSRRAGRPLVRAQHPVSTSRSPSDPPSVVHGSGTYTESGSRWMERQEARSLRMALEDMDLKDDARLHSAAQDEASELVWRHQNPNALGKDPNTPYRYREHLRKGSHTRSQSGGRFANGASQNGHPRDTSHESRRSLPMDSGSIGDSSRGSRVSSGSSANLSQRSSMKDQITYNCQRGTIHELWDSPEKKAYVNLANTRPSQDSIQGQGNETKSRILSGSSGKGLFRNSEDQIYEEPEEETSLMEQATEQKSPTPGPLRIKPKLFPAEVEIARAPPLRTNTAPTVKAGKSPNYEIYRNSPSQSRNPGYLVNALPPTPPDSASDSDAKGNFTSSRQEANLEIRGEDIREATSMQLKDRSPRLPTPSVVSDAPGRPIVSFDKKWKPKQVELKREQNEIKEKSDLRETDSGRIEGPTKPVLTKTSPNIMSGNSIPEINIYESTSPKDQIVPMPPVPSINIADAPSISVDSPPGPGTSKSDSPSTSRDGRRPLPKPKPSASRPLPYHSATAPAGTAGLNYSASGRQPTASCTQCQLPIAGRIVSAAGQRFHPECFVCFNCGEGLECVAFYPEPDAKHAERVERIQKRAQGLHVDESEGNEIDDGDVNMRFYCHLDFHELFSPRCRSCKTPIEGEVVVACGGEWHIGHFFCAECGDVRESIG